MKGRRDAGISGSRRLCVVEGAVWKTDDCVCTSFVIQKATQEPLQLSLLASDAGGSHFRYKMNTYLKYTLILQYFFAVLSGKLTCVIL